MQDVVECFSESADSVTAYRITPGSSATISNPTTEQHNSFLGITVKASQRWGEAAWTVTVTIRYGGAPTLGQLKVGYNKTLTYFRLKDSAIWHCFS